MGKSSKRITNSGNYFEDQGLSTDVVRRYSLLNIWVISFALKALLFVSYYSTDFEVHRNWLAITYNLPLAKWYLDTTSQWTLDYPPFFAYFEWVVAKLVPDFVAKEGCLELAEKGMHSVAVVYFQRTTVLISELVLFVSLEWYIRTSKDRMEVRRAYVVASSLVLSPGLLLIDHIHFQYNGMMYGFLVMMINCAKVEKYLWCGFWFTLLLCFKHIYLYLAPAVFIFLLRAYCLNLSYNKKKNFLINIISAVRWRNLFKLGTVVICVFVVAFGPFVYNNVIPQLVARLFPFSRGLTHAYWAPNAWALYAFTDRVLIQFYKNIPLTRIPLKRIFTFEPELLFNDQIVNSATRGLIGDIEFLILPKVTPQITFLLTLFYQIMALIPLFIQPSFRRFIGALTLCGYASFLFGWHVHEKAIMIVIFPFTFLVSRDKSFLAPFNLLVSSGYVSLFPLIFTSDEWLIKVLYTGLWYLIYHFNFRRVVRLPKSSISQSGIYLDRAINGYILGLIPVIIFITFIDLFQTQIAILKRFEFLKLMVISVYCSAGVISSWNGFSWLYFVDDTIWEDNDSQK